MPKTVLGKINRIINAAIRLSLGAFRSTPINNMLAKSGILPLDYINQYRTIHQYNEFVKT